MFNIPRATMHLFTGRKLDFPVLGVAFLDVMCNKAAGYGLTESKAFTNLIQRVGVTAHEIGHNWSSPHCNGSTDCALMCASLGGCTNNLQKFGSVSSAFITSAAQAANCLTVDVVPLIPILGSAMPDFGPPEGGGSIDLFGVDLLVDGTPSVSIGDVPTEILSVSDTMITVGIPPGQGGSTVDIVLLSDNGLTSLERAFRYTLNVGAGDDITSNFEPLEVERFKFSGLAGSKLTAQVIPLDPEDGLIAGLRLIRLGDDEQELIEIEGTLPGKGKPVVLKKFELPTTGDYTLLFGGLDGSIGFGRARVKLKVPKPDTESIELED